MTLKIAVLAPMPSARVSTAMAVNAGFFASIRRPKRMSRQKLFTACPSYQQRSKPNFVFRLDCRLTMQAPGFKPACISLEFKPNSPSASFITQRHQRIDPRRPPRRHITRRRRDHRDQHQSEHISDWIPRAYANQQGFA